MCVLKQDGTMDTGAKCPAGGCGAYDMKKPRFEELKAAGLSPEEAFATVQAEAKKEQLTAFAAMAVPSPATLARYAKRR